jgi:hypothetical protein
LEEAPFEIDLFNEPPDTPERRLYRALVRDALNLVYSVGPRAPFEQRRLRQEAIRWFRGECVSMEQCSFEEVCVNLDLGDHRVLVREICRQLREPPPTWGRRDRHDPEEDTET